MADEKTKELGLDDLVALIGGELVNNYNAISRARGTLGVAQTAVADIEEALKNLGSISQAQADLLSQVKQHLIEMKKAQASPTEQATQPVDEDVCCRYKVATIPVNGAFLQVAFDTVSQTHYYFRSDDGTWHQAEIEGHAGSLPYNGS